MLPRRVNPSYESSTGFLLEDTSAIASDIPPGTASLNKEAFRDRERLFHYIHRNDGIPSVRVFPRKPISEYLSENPGLPDLPDVFAPGKISP
ncbi:hypothetical protein [Laspinema palackyanum]|uniref:hypothetical protein n=1 Tax=Laspinema palackyanum TaxID=3231601 RepID=UPI00345DE0F6|nr:hypothetical protein [Laspinema sp. D2c]